jgi:signal transduction histidine kinase
MEILLNKELSIKERTLIDMHSVLNVLNVVIYELTQLGLDLGGEERLDALADSTVDIARKLDDPQEAYRQVANVEGYTEHVRQVLGQVAAGHAAEGQGKIASRMRNLESIFNILNIRAKELMARSADPNAWVEHSVKQLKDNFMDVFRAIERNSHGGYRIVTNLAEHEEGDYLVHFEISSEAGDTILMPAVFQDVMRDLLANARKYTAPGGSITAGLFGDRRQLRFVVQDNGRGIPPDEILQAVEFGRRASNVADRPTRGGGFGLTKAYYVTRKFGGRMFIDSTGKKGMGTRVELRLPMPEKLP